MSSTQHSRRHSQSVAISTSIGSLTVPHNRNRSHSTSSCTPTIAAQLFASVNSKIKEIEDADSSGFLRYVDDQVHETWDIAKAAVVGAQRLLQFHELPKEWQENEYVLSGYRFCKSTRQCLKSIFKLHNETLNIWSHLVGFVCMAFLSVFSFNRHFPEASMNDRIVFMVFCLSALKCLFCSSVYHTFICHSRHAIKSFTATLDYIGISILITASVLVTEYYGFYCQPVPKMRYMIFTVVVGSAGVIMPFFKLWDTKEYRLLRISVFLSMAFSSIVPVLHLISMNGFVATLSFFHMAGISVTMYLLGVVVYVNRFPEKLYPGRFDFAGMTSHAIWHVFVCLGIYVSYNTLLLYLLYFFS
ncbi:hemolysin-III related-domain-containing protein [Fennellomyces sp. T-0311]|nr:hemolysin-III related-domain-containing protein [Fennellomyces sp. T-0311]